MSSDHSLGRLPGEDGDEDDDTFDTWFRFFISFVIMLALTMLVGATYVLYLLLDHFGVLAGVAL